LEDKMKKVGIVGVTGYTGMELVRILLGHPAVELTYATSRSRVGDTLGQVHPQVTCEAASLKISSFDAGQAARDTDLLFMCLPHGGSMESVSALARLSVKVIDLSADMRLKEQAVYEEWYGPHSCPELLTETVSGFPEIYRQEITAAKTVANPGCYPTSIVLGLLPALEGKLVSTAGMVADSKSGVSGAGREPNEKLHFPEVAGNFSAYSIAGVHRHTAEIEQTLSQTAGEAVLITFSPHLLPLSRGILSTVYADLTGHVTTTEVVEVYRDRYKTEPFVRIFGEDEGLPGIKGVKGTNMCHLAPRVDQRSGKLVVVSCIDNLVKGAAGQAVQNMNLMLGMDESSGLIQLPLLP
jgi:N-acetyl-gamma-glutamyl-phosphate reductase